MTSNSFEYFENYRRDQWKTETHCEIRIAVNLENVYEVLVTTLKNINISIAYSQVSSQRVVKFVNTNSHASEEEVRFCA